MKINSKIIFINLAFLLFFVFAGTTLAIDSSPEETSMELPPDAVMEKKESLKEVEEIVIKETDLSIERIHPQEIKIGERLKITLKIKNLGNERVNFLVTETHKPGLEYPDEIEIKKLTYQGLEIPYYGWNLSLDPGKSIEQEYHIIPQSLGMVLFSPAVVSDEYGNSFNSNPTTLKITCHPDGKCGPGENYIFCPEDCPTGSADGICDGVEDGICDPDCEKEEDPDCGQLKNSSIKIYILIGIFFVLILSILFLLKKKRNINP